MFGQELSPQTREAVDLEHAQEVLALEHVHLHDRRVAVEDFVLRVRAGEVIGMAGLDGSGQETSMRACVGLKHFDHGRVLVCGQEMTGKSYRQFLRAGSLTLPGDWKKG
jgi:simple sugar transport system ATP-binding protein